MNNFKLYILIIFCLVVSMSSCNTDNEGTEYTPTSGQASFLASVSNLEILASESSFEVQLNRAETSEALTIPLTVTDASGVFTVPSSASFKAGEGSVMIKVDVKSTVEVGSVYVLKLAIPSENLSAGGVSTTTINFAKSYIWKSYGTGQFTSEFFEETWDQEIQKAEGFNVYRLVDCYEKGYPVMFTLSDDNTSVTKFNKQALVSSYSSYGVLSATYVKSEIEGKKITFNLTFTVSAGSFGDMEEILVMP